MPRPPRPRAIRQAVADDAKAIARLHLDVWEEAYGELMPASILQRPRGTIPERIDRWRRQLTDSLARNLVAEDANGLVGIATVGPPRVDDVNFDQELYALYVSASHWGKGVGHARVPELAERVLE